MTEVEIRRLRSRIDDLSGKVIPDLEHRTDLLFGQIMPLEKDSEDRQRLEHEYKLLFKELRTRCDERIESQRQVQRLEKQLSDQQKPRRSLLR